MLAVLEMSENVSLLSRTCIISTFLILYLSSASDMSLFSSGISCASDLVVFVLETVHVIKHRGLNPPHLGGGSEFASGQMCYSEPLLGFVLKT